MPNDKNKDLDLDEIINDINISIDKEVTKVDILKNSKNKKNVEKSKAKKSKSSKNNKTKEKLNEVINSTFAENMSIIDEYVDELEQKKQKEILKDHAVKFISVTASEVVEDFGVNSANNKNTQHIDNTDRISPISLEKKPSITLDPEISRENNKNVKKIKKNVSKRSKKQKRLAWLGMVMTLFMAIGIISSAYFSTTFLYDVINKSSLKQELAKSILPCVIIDIPEFENPSRLNNYSIISAAIWGFITDENVDKSKYQSDDLGSIYVPAVDIEYHIRKLFGNDVEINHQSVDMQNMSIYYDEESKLYNIETAPRNLTYIPEVTKVTSHNNVYTLTVKYLTPNAMWELTSKNKTNIVIKTMEYVLQKNKSGNQILAIKLLSVEGTSSSQPQVSSESSDEFNNSDVLSDIMIQATVDDATSSKVSSEAIQSDISTSENQNIQSQEEAKTE